MEKTSGTSPFTNLFLDINAVLCHLNSRTFLLMHHKLKEYGVPIFWRNLSIFHRMNILPIGKCTSKNSGHHSLIVSVFKFQLAETYSSSFFCFVQSILCLFMEIIMRRKPIKRDHRVHA